MRIFSLYSPCSNLETRQIRWVVTCAQERNGSRPSPYICWGVSTRAIVDQLASLVR